MVAFIINVVGRCHLFIMFVTHLKGFTEFVFVYVITQRLLASLHFSSSVSILKYGFSSDKSFGMIFMEIRDGGNFRVIFLS